MSLVTTLPPAPPPSSSSSSSSAYSTMHDKSTDPNNGGLSSNVSRLKNMFQTDDPQRRSPDSKRKRSSGGEQPDARPNKQRNPDGNVLEPALADPQKFYETTNHVQRFKLTRSLFEKMEQENAPSGPGYRSSRSKSPASTRTVSPSPARSPTSPIPRLTSPDKESRYRAGSVENIIDEQTYNRKYRYPPGSAAVQDLSRSESDLSRQRSGSDVVVTTSIQHPKSLIEQYESKSHSSASAVGGSQQQQQQRRSYSRSPSRDPPQSPNTSGNTGASSASSSPSLPATSEPSSSRPAYMYQSGAARREKSPEQSSRRPASTSSAGAASTEESDSDKVERWRNRYNRDKHMPQTSASSSSASVSTSGMDAGGLGGSSGGGGGGALLWKRRSQDESGISKEEIEASLADADKYFSSIGSLGRGHGETSEVLDSRMTDSTYSSGSGEEMARSESGHDLTTTPDSPTTPTNDYNWAGSNVSKYGSTSLSSTSTSSSSSKPQPMSPKPELPPKPPQSEPPSYSASMGRNGGGFPDMIQDDLDADYVDISATITPPTKNAPPTPMDSLVKKKTPPRTDPTAVGRESLQEEEDLRVPLREDGDGHESKEGPGVPDGQEEILDGSGAQVANQIWDQYFNYSMLHHARYEPVDGQVHMLQDGNFFYEVQGLPAMDPDADMYPSAHNPTRLRFNTGPIKVFSTYSVEEYDRKNEDVDPMAASAEYELEKRVERMDLFEVDLNKGSDGLGLSIIGMGVGADAGLEKLGIFIKTLTEGGAAQKDGHIEVNDQIIEVDGKSLVGVTQAYAASVLRNTSGQVKFLIGREKDPSKSEVARLIQQSLEQDRRRAEQRKQMEQVLHSPPEQPAVQAPPLPASPPPMSPPKSPTEADLLDAETADDDDNDELVSPTNAAIEVFDLPDESSSEAVTPDMDSQVLFIKLKETQYKNAVSEAELAKLKAKMILLENAESQKKLYERKCEDMATRLRETEKSLQNSQKQMASYQEIWEQSKGRNDHQALQMSEDYATLEKKYHKAKKLIKEYQNRENELLDEREARLQQQAEKEQQYNQLCKSMKDRIFQLERELAGALKAAGLPQKDLSSKDLVIPAQSVLPQKIQPVAADNLSEISGSESDSPENSPDGEDCADSKRGYYQVQQQAAPSTKAAPPPGIYRPKMVNGKSSEVVLNAVPQTQLLDTSASKTKAFLANSGALAARRPPSRKNSGASQDGLTTPNGDDEDEEDEPFITHDRDDQSDTSSLSQASYDPNQAAASGLSGGSDLIPTSVDDEPASGVSLVSSKPRQDALRSYGSAPSISNVGNSGGIQLKSARPLHKSAADSGGITLLSSRSLDTGYGGGRVSASSNHIADSSGAGMADYEHDSHAQSYDIASATLTVTANELPSNAECPVPQWSSQQVANWLSALDMATYVPLFRERRVDGQELLTLDNTKLKGMGITNSKDRDVIRKKVKDLKAAMDRERKAREKEQKAREKLERQAGGGKKRIGGSGGLFGK